jgi:hypothetical protein
MFPAKNLFYTVPLQILASAPKSGCLFFWLVPKGATISTQPSS